MNIEYIYSSMEVEEQVILVDENDRPVGTAGKLEAHKKALLHRAVSVFIFNSKGEMLLQKRAEGKYHSAGLWSNACCTHPRPGEDAVNAAERRLREEMGIDANMKFKTKFTYEARFSNGLTEHELDHVYTGESNEEPRPNSNEVEDYKWMNIQEIKNAIVEDPTAFTKWFVIAMEEIF